jgi:hypothetical protein
MATPEEFRRTALGLPGASERETWGEATFRVREKIFAILAGSGESASVKASREEQAELLAASPDVFSSAPHVGRFGWVRFRPADVDVGELAELLESAWRRTAPRSLLRDAAARGDHQDAL